MHELSIATSVLDSVVKVARDNKSSSVLKIDLVFGTSSAIVEEALRAAFDALKELSEYSVCKNASIRLKEQESKSICLDCGHEYVHGFGAAQCPKCKSFNIQIVEGTDIYIEQIEVED